VYNAHLGAMSHSTLTKTRGTTSGADIVSASHGVDTMLKHGQDAHKNSHLGYGVIDRAHSDLRDAISMHKHFSKDAGIDAPTAS
jgi:hypothetical protein